MSPRMIQKAAALVLLLLPAACGSSGSQHTVQTLNSRLHTTLGPDAAAGRVSMVPQPDGAQVVFRDPPRTPAGSDVLDDRDQYLMASVTEALLDPTLMRVAVVQAPGTPVGLDGDRARAATNYLRTYRVVTSPEVAAAAIPVPPGGLLVDIRVQCPTTTTLSDLGLGVPYGPSQPVCD
ncbi:MAG: hypothetical protein J0H67_02950 [Rhodospirillales bacterium]|nr:hypothetical protein [Rhodospirillales bacterium]